MFAVFQHGNPQAIMSTRQRPSSRTGSPSTSSPRTRPHLDIDAMSDAELEALLFEDEKDDSSGFWNLPTILGLSLIGVGVVYLLQEMGILAGFDVSLLVAMLPWVAGVMVILIGFGVLSWRPGKKKKRRKHAVDINTGRTKVIEEQEVDEEKSTRLTRSRTNKKLFGVCGGIAERFNIDATLVRIIFVVGTIFGQGAFLVAYLALAFLMPDADKKVEERITIIRDTE